MVGNYTEGSLRQIILIQIKVCHKVLTYVNKERSVFVVTFSSSSIWKSKPLRIFVQADNFLSVWLIIIIVFLWGLESNK